jgi:hypothetical protein
VSEFRNFICWHEDAVFATTPRDAASFGEGHFQAVHHPLRLRRRRLDQRTRGRWVSENEIIDALRGPLRPDGYLFIPIVGGSGTGKSHMVRWVRDQTQGTDGWESRYLPKNRTGIRRAIEIVIRGLTGPRIDEARDALESAPAQNESNEILAERLLDELALLVSNLADLPPDTNTTLDKYEQQLRKKLERQLPDVLRDPVVRRELAATGAVIPRLVGLAVRGRQEGDGLDDATRFLDTDLPLTFEEIGDTSKGARDLLGQLATIPDLLRAAVAVINEALPLAEKRVTVSGQVDLVEVFREVRRALLVEHKELVLFIEDLTVLHGVEREFLDAIVEPAISPDGDMCNLRIIFAVTDGHFDDLDTVRTRCDDAYWLDAQYGVGGVDRNEALSFLGRYLNSTRLAPDVVERKWAERSDGNWLDNGCTPCPNREICHASFGTSAEGYGLYPFNAFAASRFIQVLSPIRFDPRDLVRELINRFLLQGAADMRQSSFPSDALLTTFDRDTEPLPPLFAAEIRNLRPTDHERVVNTLRYWADDHSPVDVNDVTLSAFGIDELDLLNSDLRNLAGGAQPPTPKRPLQPEPPAPAEAFEAQLKAPWRSHFAELGQWAGRKQDLSARATNDLRNLIHKTVVANLEVGPTAVHLGPEFYTKRFNAERHIGISGTVTLQNLDGCVIVVERTETEAAALQGLILSSELDREDFSQAGYFRRLLAESVERWTGQVVAALAEPPSSAVVAAVDGLIVASVVLGKADAAKSSTDYLNSMFAEASGPPAGEQYRSQGWTDLLAQASALLPRLRSSVETEFGESRGARGEVRALQAHRLLPLVESFISGWKLDTLDTTIAPFMRLIRPAVAAEWTEFARHVSEAQPHVDRERPWQEQTEKTLSVLRAAHTSGRLRDSSALDVLSVLAAESSDRAQRTLFQVADLLTKDLPLEDRLAVLAGPAPREVAVVYAFTSRAASALEGIEQDLLERRSTALSTNLEDVVTQVLASTARFADALKRLPR